MKTFSASTTIDAEPEVIWAILTDASAYTAWNTTVEKVEGHIAPGETIKVFTKINPGRAFPVKVTALEPNRRMTWTGGMPLGLFKGVREFSLTSAGAGAAEFSMREVFSGPLSPLMGRMIPDLQPAFEEFASCLKATAEAKTAAV